MQRGLTIFMDVVMAFPIWFADIFKGQQKQHNLSLLVFNWDNIQETPKLISCEYQNVIKQYYKKRSLLDCSLDGKKVDPLMLTKCHILSCSDKWIIIFRKGCLHYVYTCAFKRLTESESIFNSPHQFSCKSRRLLDTPAGPPKLCAPAPSHYYWSLPRKGSCRCKFSASPQFGQSRSAHKIPQNNRQCGNHGNPEHFPEESYCLWVERITFELSTQWLNITG